MKVVVITPPSEYAALSFLDAIDQSLTEVSLQRLAETQIETQVES